MNSAGASPGDVLADWAVADQGTMGRAHREEPVPGLGPFEFDLKRVLSSAAFRRLQYKTQVFIAPRDDHFRTRLTHTLEVASVARLLARALRANVTLAEVIALAHDLGHPPFGHAGETALDASMRGYGGFEHNAQSLRVVDYLEHPFPPFRGLNLTYEVREALAKHRTAYDRPGTICSDDSRLADLVNAGPQPTIEGQIAAAADRIAYNVHDLEDALGASLIDRARLAHVRLWQQAVAAAGGYPSQQSLLAIRRPVLERLQHRLINDLVEASSQRLGDLHVQSPDQARKQAQPIVGFSERLKEEVEELEQFLRNCVYRHEQVRGLDDMAARMIRELFMVYIRQPEHMPRRFNERIGRQQVQRVVCDYIAGMTDRFCRSEYERIFMPFADRP